MLNSGTLGFIKLMAKRKESFLAAVNLVLKKVFMFRNLRVWEGSPKFSSETRMEI